MLALLEWALRIVVATFILLLLAIGLAFVWNAIMTVFHGPHLDYVTAAVIVAIVSVGVGSWGFSLLRGHATT